MRRKYTGIPGGQLLLPRTTTRTPATARQTTRHQDNQNNTKTRATSRTTTINPQILQCIRFYPRYFSHPHHPRHQRQCQQWRQHVIATSINSNRSRSSSNNRYDDNDNNGKNDNNTRSFRIRNVDPRRRSGAVRRPRMMPCFLLVEARRITRMRYLMLRRIPWRRIRRRSMVRRLRFLGISRDRIIII